MKIKRLFLLAILTICNISIVHAASSYSLSASSSIESGKSVTATLQLKDVAAWNVKIVSNGATSGCDSSFADASTNGKNTTKKLSVTCKSTGVGQISFRASGDVTDENGNTITVNAIKVVSVTTPREKDANNYLKSLVVKNYELTPAFNKDTLEYSVSVPSTVTKLTIEASAASSYATVEGTGEVNVNEGINTFNILVTSETGVERTYKLTVNVEDTNPISIQIDGKTYTLIKNGASLICPETFEMTVLNINEFEIPAFSNSIANITIVGIKDESGTIFYAVYNQETKSYSLYKEYASSTLNLYFLPWKNAPSGYSKMTTTINGEKVSAYKYKSTSEFALVYAMNLETGQSSIYVYDEKEHTFTRYNEEYINDLIHRKKEFKYMILALGSGFGIMFLLMLILIHKFNKNLKKKKIKLEEMQKQKEELQKSLEEKQNEKQSKKEKKKKNKKDEKKSTQEELEKTLEKIEMTKKDIFEEKTEDEQTLAEEEEMYNLFEEDE